MDKLTTLLLSCSLLLTITACNDGALGEAITSLDNASESVAGDNAVADATTDSASAEIPTPQPVKKLGITTRTISKRTRTVEFKPVTENSTLKTVEWDFGDGQKTRTANPTHSYAEDGVYDVKLTAVHSSGAKASTSTSVTANAAPIASFSGKLLSGKQLKLDASASSDQHGTITSYQWKLGDGTEKNGKVLTHRYAAAGTYSVTLTLTDDLGDSSSTTQTFKIAAAPKRIVIIGDSITQANRNTQSYRYQLWKKLINQGYSFDFVGSMNSNLSGNPNWPTLYGNRFDQDHEGHWGWRADQILGNIDNWLRGYDADIALIHIGTNDLIQKNGTVDQTTSEISQIIGKLRRDNSRITILLSNLIPFSGASNKLDQLNVKIRALASKLNNSTSRVVLVDQNTGYYVSDNYDGVHPKSPSGENKIANKYYNAIRPFL